MNRSLIFGLLLAPSTAMADTVFTFDCAPPLFVDLSAPSLVFEDGVFKSYTIPAVPWQGADISAVGVFRDSSNVMISLGDPVATHQIALQGPSGILDFNDPFAEPLDLADFDFAMFRLNGVDQCAITSISTRERIDVAVDGMKATAEAFYPGAPVILDAGPARLRTSRFRDEIAEVESRLTGASCFVELLDNVAGAFQPGPGNVVGEGSDGSSLVGTLQLDARRITGTLDALPLGANAGVYDPTHRFVFDYDGGLVAGYAARVGGRRGVFMGVHAYCPTGSSAEAALSGWIDGPLVGLDRIPDPLEGVWQVHFDCGADSTLDETWTISDSIGGGLAITGSEPFDTVEQTAPLQYSLTGTFETGFTFVSSATLVDPATLSGTLAAPGGTCTYDGTRQ